jgi:hypothetical protein
MHSVSILITGIKGCSYNDVGQLEKSDGRVGTTETWLNVECGGYHKTLYCEFPNL